MPRIRAKVIDKDRGWLRILATTRSLGRGLAQVEVGVLAGTPEGDAKAGDSDLTNAELALILQLGTDDGHIPARPVIARTIDAKREDMFNLAANLYGRMLVNKLKVTDAMNEAGAYLSSEIKKYIRREPGPADPNALSTERAKGFNHPFIEHGDLVDAFSWRGPNGVGPK